MLQGSSSRLSQLWRTVSGAISFAGEAISSAGKFYSETRDGALSLAATVVRYLEGARTYAGALSLAGAFTRLINAWRSYAGEITFSGIPTRLLGIFRATSGALSISGSLSKLFQGNRSYSSGISFSGSAVGLSQMLYTGEDAGTLSLAGAFVRQCLFFRTLNSTLEAVAPGGPEGEAANVFGFTYLDMTLRI